MIFGVEDVEVLERTINRKTLETESLMDSSISEWMKLSISKQLSKDIFRCRMMMDLASGDLNSLPANITTLTDDIDVVDDRTCCEYMSLLNKEDLADEHKFLWLYNVLLAYVPDLTNALNYAGVILSGKPPISSKEVRNLASFKSLLDKLDADCDSVESSDDRASAKDFIDYCRKECSLVLRISAGKKITIDEVFSHLEHSKTLNATGFDRCCPSLMDGRQTALWNGFNQHWKERLQLILARAICDQIFGSPYRGPLLNTKSPIQGHERRTRLRSHRNRRHEDNLCRGKERRNRIRKDAVPDLLPRHGHSRHGGFLFQIRHIRLGSRHFRPC